MFLKKSYVSVWLNNYCSRNEYIKNCGGSTNGTATFTSFRDRIFDNAKISEARLMQLQKEILLTHNCIYCIVTVSGGKTMNIMISQLSQTPIYEQMESQIKRDILSGQLKPNEMLPSIRSMAKELGVGIITVKRAYDDLCNEGLLVSLQGRGVFVAEFDSVKQ